MVRSPPTAAVPFVAKGDDVHEATFMAHGGRGTSGPAASCAHRPSPFRSADFGHYLIPDRIPSGSAFSRSPAGRRLYIAQRMASEVGIMGE
jgi:hypothetical protein